MKNQKSQNLGSNAFLYGKAKRILRKQGRSFSLKKLTTDDARILHQGGVSVYFDGNKRKPVLVEE